MANPVNEAICNLRRQILVVNLTSPGVDLQPYYNDCLPLKLMTVNPMARSHLIRTYFALW